MTKRTNDRAATEDGGSAVFTVDKIGRTRERTPEGFLLCKEVPFARAGEMLYGPGEVPVEAGRDGVVRIMRTTEELFSPATIASFNGKPLVDDHPDDDVTPETWRQLGRGVMLNVRPGTGEYDDCLVCDLLVTDAAAIKVVDEGKVEVSAGYDADYEDLGDGRGNQSNIIGNHLALVDRGRCGPRCAIGDRATVEEKHMGTRVRVHDGKRRPRVSIATHVRKAFRDAEAQAMEAFGLSPAGEGDDPVDPDPDLDDEGDGHTHIHVHVGGEGGEAPKATTADDTDPVPGAADPGAGGGGDLESRVGALEQGMQNIVSLLNEIKSAQGGVQHTPAPGGEGGDPPPADPTKDGGDDDEIPDDEDDTTATKTNDSAALASSYQETLAACELLVPGFRMATFDAKLDRKKTVDRMCQARRKALDLAYSTADGRELIKSVAATKDAEVDLDGMACKDVAGLFKAATGAKRLLTNRQTVGDGKAPETFFTLSRKNEPEKAPIRSVNDLNAYYAKHYGRSA